MHSRLAWWLASFLVVAGCRSEKVRALEADVAAAKARLVTMDGKRKALLDEARTLEVQRQTLSKQADESELARLRLVGAGEVLAGRPLPDAVLLEEALRTKSPELGALAASIVQRQLPCVDAQPDPPSDEPGPECQAPELPDECAGVDERTIAELDFTCTHVVTVAGARTTAVCLSKGTWSSSDIPWPTGAAQFEAQVLRLALEHQSRLSVADWPAPSLEIYRPPNAEELRVCGEANARAECTRRCDEGHGRLLTGCDSEEPVYGDASDEFDHDDEPAELRAAQLAAVRAEAEAEEARQELSYQQCLAKCDVGTDGQTDEAPPSPAQLSLTLRAERLPAVFAFDVTVKSADTEDPPVNGVLVLGFSDALEALGAPDPSAKDDVEPLETLLAVKQLFKQPLEGDDELWFGAAVQANSVEGARLSKKGTRGWQVLTPRQVCDLAGTHQALSEGCAHLPPPGPDAGVVLDGGAP
jgi:hypothetical protein